MNEWRLLRPRTGEIETLSDENMKSAHPAFLAAHLRAYCLRGEAQALEAYAASKLETSRRSVASAIANLASATNSRLRLAPGMDGTIIAWSTTKQMVWRLRPDVSGFDEAKIDDGSRSVNAEPILSPKGVLHLWTEGGAQPLSVENGATQLRIDPGFRDNITHNRWSHNGRLLTRSGSGVAVLDPADGSQLDFLDGGHGMKNWGFRELKNGSIISWSRLSLRSWAPATYAPMVELQDPGNWGPGYEDVISLGDHIAFFVGQYSGDSRIMIWNGGYGLTVYGGHGDEIGDLQMLGPGVFLAQTVGARRSELHL